MHRGAQPLDVVVLDVAAVGPQVRGDARGPRLLRQAGRLDGVRVRRAARLAQRRHVIDVDRESDRGHARA